MSSINWVLCVKKEETQSWVGREGELISEELREGLI